MGIFEQNDCNCFSWGGACFIEGGRFIDYKAIESSWGWN